MNKKVWLRMMLIGVLSISTAMMFSSCGGGSSDDGESDAEIEAEIAAEEEIIADEEIPEVEEGVVEDEEVVEEEDPTDAIVGVWEMTRSIAYGTTTGQIFFTATGDTEFSGDYQDLVGYEGTISGQVNSAGTMMFDLTITAPDTSAGDVWTFDGSLSEDGTTITGIMDVNGNDNTIELTR